MTWTSSGRECKKTKVVLSSVLESKTTSGKIDLTNLSQGVTRYLSQGATSLLLHLHSTLVPIGAASVTQATLTSQNMGGTSGSHDAGSYAERGFCCSVCWTGTGFLRVEKTSWTRFLESAMVSEGLLSSRRRSCGMVWGLQGLWELGLEEDPQVTWVLWGLFCPCKA